MLDFSGAPSEQVTGGEIIPEKTLAWAILSLKPYNAQQGIAETPSSGDSANKYLDVELTIVGGKYDKRKVWEKIHVANNEKAANNARAQIRAILEVGRGASIASNPQGYHIPDYFALDGLKVAIEVGFEKGKDGYRDKNGVKTFLTPNPEAPSTIKAKWEALLKNDEAVMYPTAPALEKGGHAALPLANSPGTGWGSQATGSPSQGFSIPGTFPSNPAPAANPEAKPSWLS